MAEAPEVRTTRIPRDQLAAFITSPDTLRRLENLALDVGDVLPKAVGQAAQAAEDAAASAAAAAQSAQEAQATADAAGAVAARALALAEDIERAPDPISMLVALFAQLESRIDALEQRPTP